MLFYQLLNTGTAAPREDYRRVWLEPGVPLVIGSGCVVRFYRNLLDDEQEPTLRLETSKGETLEAPVTVGFHLNAKPHAQLYLVPRALESIHGYRGQVGILRMLVEFIRLDLSSPLSLGELQ